MEQLVTKQVIEFFIIVIVAAAAIGIIFLAAAASDYLKAKADGIKDVALRNKELTVAALMDVELHDAVAEVAQRFVDPRKQSGEWTANDYDTARDKALERVMELAQSTKIYTGEDLFSAYQSAQGNAREALKAAIEGRIRKMMI